MVFEAHEEVRQTQADVRNAAHARIDEVADRALQRRDGQRFENDDQLVSPREIAEELGIDHRMIQTRLQRVNILPTTEQTTPNGKGTRTDRYYPRRVIEGLFGDDQWTKSIKAVTAKQIQRNSRHGR